MNFFQLRCFVTLAECLNYTQASDLLHMTQPTLSRSISALEDEIGARLFLRSTRSVSLTHAGILFLSRSKRLISELDDGINEVRLAEKGYYGSVRIGFLRDVYDAVSADVLCAFHKRHPHIAIELIECSYVTLSQSFENGTVDAVLGPGLEMDLDPGEEEQIVLFELEDCVVCSLAHPLVTLDSTDMKRLRNENFVVLTRTSSSFRHDSLFQMAMNAGFMPNIVAQASFVHGIFMLVASNTGVSILPRNLEYMTKGRIHFITLLDAPKRKWALSWKKTNVSPALRLLTDVVRDMLN